MIACASHDPAWQKARVAARILLKAQHGKSLSSRDKRLARVLGHDAELPNNLIHRAGCWIEAEQLARAWTTARTLPTTILLAT